MASTSTDTIFTVNHLNDDVLLHIFSYLSTKESFKIERVCKRWQKILKTMGWKNITIPGEVKGDWEDILWKCGKIVTNLCIHLDAHIWTEDEDISYDDVEEGFEAVNDFCKKLLHFDVQVDYFDPEIFLDVQRFPFLKKLKSLNISPVQNRFDDKKFLEVVLLLFKEAKSLEKFSCTDGCRKKIFIDNHKKEIVISRLVCSADSVLPIWRRFPGFTKLKLECISFSYDMLNPISNQLNSLEFEYYPGDYGLDKLEKLEFNNLSKLKFSECYYLKGKDIFTFVKKCPLLQEVCLNYSDFVINSDAYRHLGKLKELTVLEIESIKLTGNILDYLAQECNKLEEIRCSRVQNLSALELENIIAVLPNLKFFKIQGLKNYTRKCFESVLETVQQRKNGQTLQIEFAEGLKLEEIDAFKFREIEENLKKLKTQLLIIRLNLINEQSSSFSSIWGPKTSIHLFCLE